ncbi:MAG: cytochrome c oxidase subunit 3 [Ekhidna sp.]|nr:cytochrome c oxidase subunit 3 [Ekhidna sp.]MBC6411042.1 cytochrome c oxidase subunit 3 [Ekhidna sp.]MBC6426235.1 cytochrome c oxidase subunit 3 [Ekhidna sp.]
MSEKEVIQERIREKKRMTEAGRMMTRLFIATSSLIFLTFIIVWLFQDLPEVSIPIIYEAAAWFILVSSALIVMSQITIRKDDIEKAFWFTAFGLVFGLLFMVLQFIGWSELLDSNTTYRNILFPFSLVHFIHILVGIILLLTVFAKIRKYKVHSRSKNYAFNVFMFWHFLGIIWLLFIGVA